MFCNKVGVSVHLVKLWLVCFCNKVRARVHLVMLGLVCVSGKMRGCLVKVGFKVVQ